MAEYQNIFTRVQVHGATYPGVPLGRGASPRIGEGIVLHWLGKLGDAQIGPFYLGWTGLASCDWNSPGATAPRP